MLIDAKGGLYVARRNLKLALKESRDTDAYRRYVQALERQVEEWEQRVAREWHKTIARRNDDHH